MNQYPSLRRLGAAMAAMCLVTAVCTAGLVSCGSSVNREPSGTAAPTAPVTMPDLTDNREPTSTHDYAERVNSAFAFTPVTPSEDFTYEVGEDGVTVTGYEGGEVVLLLPDTIEGKPVVAIAAGAFAGKGTLQAISLPDSVTTVGVGALKDCNSLTTLRTPVCTSPDAPYFGALFGATTYEINASAVPLTLKTLIVTAGTSIPDYGFYDCPMEVIALPGTVAEIGDFAFYGCDSLAYLPLGHTAVETVGDWAFTNCSKLLSLDIPATAETLGFAMLEGCGALEELALPFVGSNRAIAKMPVEDDANNTNKTEDLDGAYLGYLFGAKSYVHTAGYLPASLIRVTLHEGCSAIPPNAFFECASIREILLPESVCSIGRRAFYGCERLASMTLPAGVTILGDDAFHGCIRLVALTGGEGLTTLGVQVFMNCLSLESVTLPATVTALPNSTFAGCRSLVTLVAPGVTEIGAQVFRHCEKLTGWSETAAE